MALPKIKHPTYAVTIPSIKKEVNIRPFTVQEEKLLLMARASNKPEDIVSTIKQIIQNCITESIDVEKLATFDIEYLFLKLRAKSVGETVELEHKEEDDDVPVKFKINLDDIQVKYNPAHSNKFFVQDNIGISMRYPTLEEVTLLEGREDKEKAVFEVLFKCIDKIFDEETVYSDFDEKELNEFVNNLPMEALVKIKDFFDTMPTVEHTVEIKDSKGKKKEIVLRGLNSFFT
jgi:hypothetical protein